MVLNLKQARLDLGLSIEEISESLKIRKKYLVALEEGEYDILPGNTYVVGYLKSYSKFLKIEFENINIDAQDKIKIANVEIKNSKTQSYLVVISIFFLAVIVIAYYQIFSNKGEEMMNTYPNSEIDAEQLNLNDRYEYK